MTVAKISDTNPIHYQDATALAALIRTKKLSSREVVQVHLDRINAVNPQINAVVTLMAEDALKGADLADKAVADGAALGPLHGVPFSIKDSLDTAGVLTQRGSKLFAGNIPDKDATAVARFKAAGGIPLMKTNLPEFSFWTESDNLVTGRNRVWRLGRDLHRGFALDLGLESDFFESKLDKPNATLRLLHYPPVTSPPPDGQLGAGAHTDYGNVTLLATDAVGGLMVRDRSGRWLDAPVVPGAFICNIGDCLMRWSNDVYVSTPHKVVSPLGADRYSVAFFLDPNPDAMVACLPTCTSADRPARYKPVTGADFLRSRLEPTYASAKT